MNEAHHCGVPPATDAEITLMHQEANLGYSPYSTTFASYLYRWILSLIARIKQEQDKQQVKWTTTLPSVSGWYWVDASWCNGELLYVSVDSIGTVHTPYRIFAKDAPSTVRWAGPIPEPEEP